MYGENLTGWGGADPDDLAVVICAALAKAGRPYRVVFGFADGKACAIHIYSGEPLVCSLALAPIEMTRAFARTLAGGIEALARVQGVR